MHIIRGDQALKDAAQRVVLHTNDLVQVRDPQGEWKHQWELPSTPGWEEDYPNAANLFRLYYESFHSGLSDIYTQQGLLRLRLTGVKLMWTTVGFAPVENQVLVMIILPLLAITDVEERIVGGKERSLDTEPARVLKPASTPLQQSPSTMPVEKLAEPRLAAIYHSPGPRFERRFEPFDLEPGDVLAVHGKEGVIVRTGTFGSMLFEYQSETRVEIVENQGREKAASSVA